MSIQLSNGADARKAIFLAKCIEHKERSRILKMIIEAGSDGIDVTSIYTSREFVNLHGQRYMEQSVCSQHLAGLLKHGLVNVKKDGKRRIYTANTLAIELANAAIVTLAGIVAKAA